MSTKTITPEQAVPEYSTENASPQVTSLETENDKQVVVESEVLKPSDNKDYSKAEAADFTEEKLEAASKKAFTLSQEAMQEQRERIEFHKKKQEAEQAHLSKRNVLIEANKTALNRLGNDYVEHTHRASVKLKQVVNDNIVEVDTPIEIKLLFEQDENNMYVPIWSIVSEGKKLDFRHDITPEGVHHSILATPIADYFIGYINTDEAKNALKNNLDIFQQVNDTAHTLLDFEQSNFKHFEGISINRSYRFEEINAYKIRVCKREDGTTYEQKELVGSPCAVISRFRFNGNENVQYLLRFINTNSIEKEVVMTQAEFDSFDGLRRKLGQAGCRIRDSKNFMEMLNKNFDLGIEKGELPILNSVDTMGWIGDSYLNGSICCGITKYFCQDKNILEEYYKEGTEEKYSEGISGLANIEEVRIAMSAMIASMILRIVGCPSFTMIVHGETSKIKTTRWKAASSMVGNPNKIIMTFDQSAQVLNQKLKRRRDTFLILDEAKTEKDKEKGQEAIKHIQSGTTRQVYRFSEEKVESSEVCCILMMTSEHSLFDAATFGGTLVRCLEFKTSMNQDLSKEIETFEDLVAPKVPDFNPKNFGWLVEPIYDVIHKNKKELRARFKEIRNNFDRSSAKTNRISDMQAVLVLGLELLDEVFANKKDVYPWYVPLDNFQIVDELTSDHVENAAKPEFVKHLELVLSHFSIYSMYMNPPEPQGEQNIVHTQPIKGYIKTDKKLGKMYMLNAADVQQFLTTKKINYDTFVKDLCENGITKVYTKKDKKGRDKPNGFTIQGMDADSLIGGQYVAVIVNKIGKYIPIPEEEIADELENRKNTASEILNSDKELNNTLTKARNEIMIEYFKLYNPDSPVDENIARTFCRSAPKFNEWLISGEKIGLFIGFQP